jgi:hypothetical protein
MSFLQRRRARFLIKRAQGFADEPLVAVANFTWVGNSMAAQPGVRGRGEWAGGLPDWTLIGAGANRLFVIAAHHARPDKGTELIGSWPLAQVQMTEESYPREAGPVPLVPGVQSVSSFPTANPPCCSRSDARWTTCCRHTERHNRQTVSTACAGRHSPRSR